jgi:hypothetical protein
VKDFDVKRNEQKAEHPRQDGREAVNRGLFEEAFVQSQSLAFIGQKYRNLSLRQRAEKAEPMNKKTGTALRPTKKGARSAFLFLDTV